MIPLHLFAYRFAVHLTTGVTPAEIYTGADLRLPSDLIRRSSPIPTEPSSSIDYILQLKTTLNNIHNLVRHNTELSSQWNKKYYDRSARYTDFSIGQQVWFFNPRRTKGRTPKLHCNWDGPYIVVQRINDIVDCIQQSPRHKKKVFHVDRLATYHDR